MFAQFCYSSGFAISGLAALILWIWVLPAPAENLSQSAADLQGSPAHLPAPAAPLDPLDPLTESTSATRVTVPPLEPSLQSSETLVGSEQTTTADTIAPPASSPEPATFAPPSAEGLPSPSVSPPDAPPTNVASRWPNPIPFGQPLPR